MHHPQDFPLRRHRHIRDFVDKNGAATSVSANPLVNAAQINSVGATLIVVAWEYQRACAVNCADE